MSAASGVRLVLGFSPGSLSDLVARILRDALTQELGSPVTIDLTPGLDGMSAAIEVARSKADGSTLFLATLGTHAIAPFLSAMCEYDPLGDFTCISLVSRSPMLLACHPSVAATSVKELIECAGATQLTYGTSAIGGAPHLAAELFQRLTGVTMRHVRYDQTETLYRDLEAGRVALSFNNIISMLPRCRSGALSALGISSQTRAAVAFDIPTIEECGVAGYDMTNWVGIVGPRGMPAAMVDRLSVAVSAAIKSKSVSAELTRWGILPCGGTSFEFASHIRSEVKKWRPIVERLKAATNNDGARTMT